MQSEITEQITQAQTQYDALKELLRFTGKYDSYDVMLRIQAGAGGTDAQDWAAMLLKMYSRFASKQGDDILSAELITESRGDEAGIKSATLQISGVHAFGR